MFLEIIILSKGHFLRGTGDARNPAPVDRYLVYPILYRVLNIPGGAGFLPSTVVSTYDRQICSSTRIRVNIEKGLKLPPAWMSQEFGKWLVNRL